MLINFEEIRRMADQIRELTGDDQDTLLDTLDGETDAMDILGKLIQERTNVPPLRPQQKSWPQPTHPAQVAWL